LQAGGGVAVALPPALAWQLPGTALAEAQDIAAGHCWNVLTGCERQRLAKCCSETVGTCLHGKGIIKIN